MLLGTPFTPVHRRDEQPIYEQTNPPTSDALSESVTKDIRPKLTFRFTGTLTNRQMRSDVSILTCFDPADKELYDLWVPKR